MTLKNALITLLPFALLGGALAQPGDAEAILDAVIDNLRGSSQRATLTMTVERPERTTEYTLDIVSDGEERALTRVVAPPREAGQAFLNVDRNIFIYNPRLKRVLRLPPSGRSNSFLGSDISYNDLTGDDYRDDYTVTLAAEGDAALTLELTPAPQAPTPYGLLRFRVDAATYAPLELTFFDQRGEAVKVLTFSDIQEVNGRFVPYRFEVRDLTSAGSVTVAQWTDVTHDAEIPERCFSEQALERGCE